MDLAVSKQFKYDPLIPSPSCVDLILTFLIIEREGRAKEIEAGKQHMMTSRL